MDSVAIRACGVAVAAGGVVWGTVGLLTQANGDETNAVDVWSSGVFLLGAVALVAAMAGTRATGPGKVGRAIVAVELVLLGLAALSTLITLSLGQWEMSGVLLALDTAWPLSQVGLIVVAVAALVSRVWPTRTAWLALATALWLPVGFVAPEVVVSIYLIVVPLLLGVSVAVDVPGRDVRHAPPVSPVVN